MNYLLAGVRLLKDLLLELYVDNINFYFPYVFYDTNLSLKLSMMLDKNLENLEINYDILKIFNLLTKNPKNVNIFIFYTQRMYKSLIDNLDQNQNSKTDGYSNNQSKYVDKESIYLSNIVDEILSIFGNIFLKDAEFACFYEKSTELLDKIELIAELSTENELKKSILYNLYCWTICAEKFTYETCLKICKKLCLYNHSEFKNKVLILSVLENLSCIGDIPLLNHIHSSNIIQEIISEIHIIENENLNIFVSLTFIISKLSELDVCAEILNENKCLVF